MLRLSLRATSLTPKGIDRLRAHHAANETTQRCPLGGPLSGAHLHQTLENDILCDIVGVPVDGATREPPREGGDFHE